MTPMEQSLIDAIQNGDAQTVTDLLATTPGLADTRTQGGVSALLLAIYGGRRSIARQIAENREGLDIFEAAALGHRSHLERSLELDPEGAEHYSADGLTPLHLAARFNQPEACQLLLDRGADPDRISDNPLGFRPLHAAVAGHSLEAAELLLDAGATPDARQGDGLTSLMAAAATGQIEVVELLLDHGADPDLRSKEGLTARDLARTQSFEDIESLL